MIPDEILLQNFDLVLKNGRRRTITYEHYIHILRTHTTIVRRTGVMYTDSIMYVLIIEPRFQNTNENKTY